ncbi:MAG TPA: asparagine synthase (glutamine-hydrolyzing) [Candidatus Brocadiia bacterium]|nr:asparagine synthase (glutamine-hydrolyzing) [Candidatus Brocadiia bacterium]
MCGICGIASVSRNRLPDPNVLKRMCSLLAHRGPDGEGTYFTANAEGSALSCALGHRRLSVIDLQTGAQPMANEDGSVRIVFNGEIYNYRELARQLESGGHRLRTRSDTEVILHLYEDKGEACVEYLRGMFAFALLDERKGCVLLARDRLGKKPLFYRLDEAGGTLAFASELKALLADPGMPRRVDPEAIDAFLTYQYVPHPQCILKDARKLPPAHTLLWQDGRATLRRYWRPVFEPDNAMSEQDAVVELKSLLEECVRLRLISDVPLGAFLSGGLDSSITVALMSALSNKPVETFSIGFREKKYNELEYAGMVARKFGTKHTEFMVSPDAMSVLPRLVWHYDEPFADSSAIPTFLLSELTRRSVTVALTGDAGDECFAGYPRYKALWLASQTDALPKVLRRALYSKLWQELPASSEPKTLRRRLKRFAAGGMLTPRERYMSFIEIFSPRARHSVYSPEMTDTLQNSAPENFLARAYAECSDPDFLNATTFADLMTYLPCDLLTKVDIASMAHGLECRSPFLDHKLVEFCARLPIRFKLSLGLDGLRGKRILLKAYGDILPEPVVKRPKMGFGVPIAEWLRGGFGAITREMLLSDRATARGYFRRETIERLMTEHVQGRADHGYKLWALLMLEMWHRTFLDCGAAIPDTPV